MTGASGCQQAMSIYRWAGTTNLCWILGYRRLATLRSLYVSGTLRQDTACRQATAYSGMR